MKSTKQLTIAKLLENTDDFSDAARLYLPFENEWDENTKCVVFSGGDDDLEELSIDNSIYEYVFGIHQVKDIITNAKLQKSNLLAAELLEAFIYYYKNDAFCDFSES